MKFLKKFATRAEYDAFMDTNTDFPFVGYVADEKKVEYMAELPTIQFEDAEVLRVLLANGVGSDGKITERQAKEVTSIGTWFKGNTAIKRFKELRYFTSIKEFGDAYLNNTGSPFAGCSNLEVVYLPESTTFIGNFAFDNCDKLDIVCLATTPPIYNLYPLDGQRMYVPAASVDAFKTKWSSDASKIYPLSQYTE
jgi:hypothetical protein